jgi:transcriptional regulator with XRE-family HTH domain
VGAGAGEVTFGALVRAARERAGLMQGAVAARMGVSKSAVSLFERGLRSPREATLIALADALDLRPDVLRRYLPDRAWGAWARVPWEGPAVSVYPDGRTLSIGTEAMRLLGLPDRAVITTTGGGTGLRIEPCVVGGYRLRATLPPFDTRQANASGVLGTLPARLLGRRYRATLRDGGLDVTFACETEEARR